MEDADDQLADWMTSALRSAQEVLSSLSCTTAELDVLEDNWMGGGAYVSVDTEEHTYLLALVTDEGLQFKLTSALLGGSISQSPAYFRDAMGELSNMIAGLTKSRMAKVDGSDMTLGLPFYIHGHFHGSSVGRTRTLERAFRAGGHVCKVLVIQQQVSGEAVRRREVERELRDAEERQRAILEAAPDPVITTDAGGAILTFNSAADLVFGHSAEDIKGIPIPSLLHLPQSTDDGAQIQAEGVGIRADGSTFPAEVSVSSFRFRDTVQYAYVVRDITTREAARKAIEEANQRTIELSHAAGKAEVAADVLHNVGNVLNSINTTTALLGTRIERSKIPHLARTVELLDSHRNDLGDFIVSDPKGKKILPFLRALSEEFSRDLIEFKNEVQSTQKHVDHIKRVIMTQQLIATAAGVTEEVQIPDLIHDALAHVRPLIEGGRVDVVQQLDEAPRIFTDKNKLLQIVINLIKNACEAVGEANVVEPSIELRSTTVDGLVVLEVIDNGTGISDETMSRLFSHGFTTKKTGHGFGLHGSAIYAKQLGGELAASSLGVGRGSTFTLRLPLSRPGGTSSPFASAAPLQPTPPPPRLEGID